MEGKTAPLHVIEDYPLLSLSAGSCLPYQPQVVSVSSSETSSQTDSATRPSIR